MSIGVLFKSTITNKTFIRIKKLTYKINYLTQFIELDPETGFFINKFTNNQLTLGSAHKTMSITEALNQLVAQHQDQLIDLNAIFLRNLAPKVSKNKLDSRF